MTIEDQIRDEKLQYGTGRLPKLKKKVISKQRTIR